MVADEHLIEGKDFSLFYLLLFNYSQKGEEDIALKINYLYVHLGIYEGNCGNVIIVNITTKACRGVLHSYLLNATP